MVHKHLLIIGSVWPEPDSSAAGKRMMELIRLFKLADWDITFASTASQTSHMVDLTLLDINAVPVSINDPAFDDFIYELQPGAVLFDRFMIEEQFGWRVAEQCPSALRILDTEDLHCLRRSRRQAIKENRPWSQKDLLQNETAKREIASILRSDCSLIISEYEMKILQEWLGVDTALLSYVPFMLEPLEEQEQINWPRFEERKNFMTIGNFRHSPNMDSVRYLRESVWLLIRQQLPSVELRIFGAYPSRQAEALHQPREGFMIEGRIPNAKQMMRQARVCLAPLRFGAGLKGKLVTAMQCGTPSVTTPIGAEGMAGAKDWAGIVAENPKELAQAAITLYTDKKEWQQAQNRGIAILNQRFDGRQHGARLIKQIETLRQNLEAHRQANFTGAMLMHHTAASTKYMSRWIEEKNRR